MIFTEGEELRKAIRTHGRLGHKDSVVRLAERYDVTETELRLYAGLIARPPTLREKLQAIITDAKELEKS
jgi:hypothetical protein